VCFGSEAALGSQASAIPASRQVADPPGRESQGRLFSVWPGTDRDDQGCIGSAGFVWCERTRGLAAIEGFENSHEEIEAFCSGQK
jgi:hypothetical protein